MKQIEGTIERIIDEDTCCFEFQAMTSLRPACENGLNCPYKDNKSDCNGYKRLGNTELRWSYLNLNAFMK